MGCRLMVGQEILVLFIMVRIRAPQPIFKRTLVVRFNIGFVSPVLFETSSAFGVTGSIMSKRKQALRSLSANECGAVSALPTEPIRAQFFSVRKLNFHFLSFQTHFRTVYNTLKTFELTTIL